MGLRATLDAADGNDCRLIKIVDDLAFSESDQHQTITKNTIEELKKRYRGKVTSDLNPTSFAGYKVEISRTEQGTTVTLSQERKVTEAARKYLPELLEGKKPTNILEGKALEAALTALTLPAERSGKLSQTQKRVQQIIGDLKYFERGTMPRISRKVHHLSCIMSFPPEGALQAAEGVLAEAYAYKDSCIRFGGECVTRGQPSVDGRTNLDMSKGAPAEMEVTADASNVIPAVMGILITYAGAAVLHQTKKIGVAVGSTHDAENVATVKASEHAVYGRTVLHALGVPPKEPTRLLTDNLSNQRVAQNASSAVNSRYFLIRSTCLHQRVTDGELTVLYVPDPENPSDFLTKFIDASKTNASVAYAAGAARP